MYTMRSVLDGMVVPTTQGFRKTTALSLEIEVTRGRKKERHPRRRQIEKSKRTIGNAESPGLIGIDGQQKQQRIAFVDGHDEGIWQTAASFAYRTPRTIFTAVEGYRGR